MQRLAGRFLTTARMSHAQIMQGIPSPTPYACLLHNSPPWLEFAYFFFFFFFLYLFILLLQTTPTFFTVLLPSPSLYSLRG